MTRKEKITKILDKYWIRRGWIESDESMVEARLLTAKEELADAIMALPIHVPSEEEINMESQMYLPRNYESTLTEAIIIAFRGGHNVGAQWAINEILKRNGNLSL